MTDIPDLLKQYKQVTDEMAADGILSQALTLHELLDKLLNKLSAPYEARLNELTSTITSQVLRLGQSVLSPHADASYTSGYTRRSWDSDKLEGYAMAHPEVLAFKKETHVAPRVKIKVH